MRRWRLCFGEGNTLNNLAPKEQTEEAMVLAIYCGDALALFHALAFPDGANGTLLRLQVADHLKQEAGTQTT